MTNSDSDINYSGDSDAFAAAKHNKPKKKKAKTAERELTEMSEAELDAEFFSCKRTSDQKDKWANWAKNGDLRKQREFLRRSRAQLEKAAKDKEFRRQFELLSQKQLK